MDAYDNSVVDDLWGDEGIDDDFGGAAGPTEPEDAWNYEEELRERSSEGDRAIKRVYPGDWRTHKGQAAWKVLPGEPGFNEYVQGVMASKGIKPRAPTCSFSATKVTLQPYQETVKWLVHPATPINRFLAVHRTGAGKTLEMIKILENFWEDDRPRVLLFPTGPVRDNFYKELLKFPSRFRDLLYVVFPDLQRRVDRKDIDGAVVQDIKNLLSYKRQTVFNMRAHPDILKRGKVRNKVTGRHEEVDRLGFYEDDAANGKKVGGLTMPQAPMRAYSYSKLDDGDSKVVLEKGSANKLEGKRSRLVIMDEAHNLLFGNLPRGDPQYRADVAQLLPQFAGMSPEGVLVGLTATPFVTEPRQFYDLLQTVKGPHHRQGNNEGFVSYFQSLPEHVFASVTPGPPDFLPMTRETPIGPDALKEWLGMVQQVGLRAFAEGQAPVRAMQEASLLMGAGKRRITSADRELYMSRRAAKVAPKYVDIAGCAKRFGKKCVVMIDNSLGAQRVFEWILQGIGWNMVQPSADMQLPRYRGPTFLSLRGDYRDSELGNLGGKTRKEFVEEQLSVTAQKLFNSKENARGEQVQMIVLDTNLYSEGFSTFDVRRIYLADVPYTYTAYLQRIGRALRMCGHENLPVAERKLELVMPLATDIGGRHRDRSWDKILHFQLLRSAPKALKVIREIADLSVDNAILKEVLRDQPGTASWRDLQVDCGAPTRGAGVQDLVQNGVLARPTTGPLARPMSKAKARTPQRSKSRTPKRSKSRTARERAAPVARATAGPADSCSADIQSLQHQLATLKSRCRVQAQQAQAAPAIAPPVPRGSETRWF